MTKIADLAAVAESHQKPSEHEGGQGQQGPGGPEGPANIGGLGWTHENLIGICFRWLETIPNISKIHYQLLSCTFSSYF